MAQPWDSAWGTSTATRPVNLRCTRIVAYLFHNWDWQSDPGNGAYGRTHVGRLITGLFEEHDQGHYVFRSGAAISPMIERMLELDYVRPDNFINESILGKRCKAKLSAASSEVP